MLTDTKTQQIKFVAKNYVLSLPLNNAAHLMQPGKEFQQVGQ